MTTSADIVVPLVMGLQPRSVVDVGCARGEWLAAFAKAGVEHIQGFDVRVPPEGFLFDPGRFSLHDLTVLPLPTDRTYDLAVCLEVAEHLPAELGPPLVKELIRLAPAVLFGAAIPGQGAHGRGDGHINERWQSYWADQFAVRGFRQIDMIRSPLWDHPGVDVVYRQNIFIYTKLPGLPLTPKPVDMVHPGLWSIEVGR